MASTSVPLGQLHAALSRATSLPSLLAPAKPQSTSAPATRTPSPDAKRTQFYVAFCSSTSRIASLHQRALSHPLPISRGRSRSVPVHGGWARPVDYRDDRSYEALNREFQSTPPSSDGEEVLKEQRRGRSRSGTTDGDGTKADELDEEHFLDELI